MRRRNDDDLNTRGNHQALARGRLTIIEHLWDSLDARDVPVTAAQPAELARRLDALEEGRAGGVTWEELKTDLARRTP